jgi:CheY-like chemotaxis protein
MRKRLLIIEDDYDVAELLVLYFRQGDYEVLHAANGTEGIAAARVALPHLILLDVMLPDMDGYDVCYTLRQVAFTRYIPIIFLTQRDERASKVAGLALGADDYVTKPFDIEELWLRVGGAIHRATRDHLHEPRSGLPTGELVVEERTNRRENATGSLELIFNIENYIAFRDVYGFIAADEVFAFAGRIIREAVSELGTQDDFVGVEVDNFIVMTYAADPGKLVSRIRSAFQQGARAFYPDRDVQRGGVVVNAGSQSAWLAPLMTMHAYVYS